MSPVHILVIAMAIERLSIGQVQDDLQLFSVLAAHAKAVETFKADARVTQYPGADRPRMAIARRAFATLLRKEGEDPAIVASVEKDAGLLADLPPSTTLFYRYASTPDVLRLEEYGSAIGGQPPYNKREPTVQVNNGTAWEIYTPIAQIPGPRTHPELLIHGRSISPMPFLEIARGQAVFAHSRLQHLELSSKRAVLLSQAPLREFLDKLDLKTCLASEESLSSNGPRKPVIVLNTSDKNDFGMPLYRAKIWFDPVQQYLPIRMECQTLEPDAIGKKHYYLNSLVCEWSDPTRLSNGSFFSQKAVIRFLQNVGKEVEDQPYENWPSEAMEIAVQEVVFSNVRVNEPIPASFFRIDPPKGTQVLDEVGGHAYFIGDLGEHIQKTAIDFGNRFPEPEIQKTPFWKKILYVLGMIFLFVVLLIAMLRLRWSGRKGATSLIVLLIGAGQILADSPLPEVVERSPHRTEKMSRSSSWCGPRVLFFFSCLYDKGMTLEQVKASCKSDTEGMTALSDMNNAAQSLGLEPRAVKSRPAGLLSLTGPAIVCLRTSVISETSKQPSLNEGQDRVVHYIGFLRREGDSVWLFDPSYRLEPFRVSLSDLEGQLTGHALLLAGCKIEDSPIWWQELLTSAFIGLGAVLFTFLFRKYRSQRESKGPV